MPAPTCGTRPPPTCTSASARCRYDDHDDHRTHHYRRCADYRAHCADHRAANEREWRPEQRAMITTPFGRPIARARRSTELGLVIVGFAITAAAYTLGALGRTATLPANIFPFLGVVFGLLLIAHIATRILAPGADPIL